MSTNDRYRSMHGSEAHVYVDLHIQVARGTTIEEGHVIAHEVEAALRREYGQITDVVVHVEPEGARKWGSHPID